MQLRSRHVAYLLGSTGLDGEWERVSVEGGPGLSQPVPEHGDSACPGLGYDCLLLVAGS